MLVELIQTTPALMRAATSSARLPSVLGPDGGGEAIAGVVGERDRFIRRAEGGGDQHRTEDFLAGNGRGLDTGDQRRRIEAAPSGQQIVGAKELEPFFSPSRISRLMRFELSGRDNRADVERDLVSPEPLLLPMRQQPSTSTAGTLIRAPS